MIRGLTSEEAARRLAERGPNEIRREEVTPAWRIFLRQFRSVLVGLLWGATAISALLGEATNALAIAAILMLNAVVGFLQEQRAERAVVALRSLTAPRARVLRDGRSVIVPAREVVPGDVLVLEAGDLVAADARLLEAHALTANEAPLTGESAPVEKKATPAPAGAPLAERHDRVFMGTSIATGSGLAEVFASGMDTELGKIAGLLASAQVEQTPLQRRLAQVGRVLFFVALGIIALVALLGLARGAGWLEVLMSSVALAVAAVPEGLAAIVTVALAVGVQRMAARHVLVRRLAAVETLGSATVICTDKTGTLTTGVMAVRDLWGKDHRALLYAAAACCDAELAPDGRGGTGDPTEVAILMAAAEREIRREEIERDNPRMLVHPFDSDRKRMSVRRADGTLYVKGALEVILERAVAGTDGALEEATEMAERGLRVLAVAVGKGDEERDLTLLGLLGIADPPRTEAIEAVAQARRAGVQTVMITGDHPVTARAVARELGILRPGDDPAELVHARATAQDKLVIVRRWKARGAVVAMTGDGVNDAPALKEAHIGVAMGCTGTEVTREASAMILTDDNYASIVAAIQEGRGVYDNIQKTLVYLLAGNLGELLIMLVASAAGLPLPLLPLQLLWVNLVTDGLPALALVMDPADPDVMRRPPRAPSEPMLGRAQWVAITLTGAIEATATLSVFAWALRTQGSEEARNLAFSTLVFAEVFRAFAARSPTRIFWAVGPFSNVRLLAAVVLSIGLQLGLHHVPVGQRVFGLQSLSVADLALSLGVGLIPVSALELLKLLRRAFAPRAPVGPGAAADVA